MTDLDDLDGLWPPPDHRHDWERGIHMAEAFGVDGRRFACAICGKYRGGGGTGSISTAHPFYSDDASPSGAR